MKYIYTLHAVIRSKNRDTNRYTCLHVHVNMFMKRDKFKNTNFLFVESNGIFRTSVAKSSHVKNQIILERLWNRPDPTTGRYYLYYYLYYVREKIQFSVIKLKYNRTFKQTNGSRCLVTFVYRRI